MKWQIADLIQQIVTRKVWTVHSTHRSIAFGNNRGRMHTEVRLHKTFYAVTYTNNGNQNPFKNKQTTPLRHKNQQQRHAIEYPRKAIEDGFAEG